MIVPTIETSRLCDQFHKKLPNNVTMSQLMNETHAPRKKKAHSHGDSGEKMSLLIACSLLILC